MIHVTFDPNKYDLQVEGHAVGADAVCASASTLVYTLESSLESLGKQAYKGKPKVKIKEGNGRIYCKPKADYEPNIALIYHTILCGFKALSENYPEHVKFEVVGG